MYTDRKFHVINHPDFSYRAKEGLNIYNFIQNIISCYFLVEHIKKFVYTFCFFGIINKIK